MAEKEEYYFCAIERPLLGLDISAALKVLRTQCIERWLVAHSRQRPDVVLQYSSTPYDCDGVRVTVNEVSITITERQPGG